MSGQLAVATGLKPEQAYAYRNPRPVWGEHLPHRQAVKGADGKDYDVVAEGTWWTQNRVQRLMLWLDECVSAIKTRLFNEPEMRVQFVRWHIDHGEVSGKTLDRFGDDIEAWTPTAFAEASALRPDLLLQLVDLAIVPDPSGRDLIPPMKKQEWERTDPHGVRKGQRK